MMKHVIETIGAGGRPTFDELVSAFAPDLPWLHDLESTPQDPEWHAEGNVAIHTRMVVDAIYDELEGHAVSADTRISVVLGALLHDVAKPVTTVARERDGRTRLVCPRHPEKGRSYVAYRSSRWPIRPEVRRNVLAMIGHHHDHRRLDLGAASAHRWHHLAELVPLALLHRLARADILGRICDDRDDALEKIELFHMQADELSLFDEGPWPGWREHIEEAWRDESPQFQKLALATALEDARRGEIFSPEEGVARAYRFRDGFAHLVVLCGPSGAGKSTWTSKNLDGYERIALDDIREELTGDAADQSRNGEVRQLAQQRLRRALAAHRPVVWDASNLRQDFRRVPLDLGRAYGALTTLVVFDTDLETCRRRNRERDRRVPETVLERQFERAEYPRIDEAHEALYPGDDAS